jgi:hypothetical protein
MADLFCRAARARVERLFDSFYGTYDAAMYRLAQQVMRGEHAWMETGIVSMLEVEPSEGEEERGGEAPLEFTRSG